LKTGGKNLGKMIGEKPDKVIHLIVKKEAHLNLGENCP